MPEPTIVPPTPTIGQQPPEAPSSDAQVAKSIQETFDRIMPDKTKKGQPSSQTPPALEPPASPPPPQSSPGSPPEVVAPPRTPEETDVPSFLEQALRGEPSTETPPAPGEDEWPEELPTFKNSDEAKGRYKRWREAHQRQRDELKALKERPSGPDPAQQHRMEQLETQNRQMQEVLTRMGVEHSSEFQQQIIAPLQQSWNEAARIVRDAGGNPAELAKAMTLSGKAQFEALDTIFEDMPDSAKMEAQNALHIYRRYEEARQNAIKNAPQALEGIRKREMERQMADIDRQRENMRSVFESALKRMRDDKLEVLMRTDAPEAKWWNEQGDRIVEQARSLYLENTDMNKVALACLLAPAADAYRKLWINSQKKIGQLQKIINDRIGSEPNLTEHGGPGSLATPEQQFKDDLRKPWSEVFLREVHKQQAATR